MAEEIEVSKATAVAVASIKKNATTLGAIKQLLSTEEVKKRFTEVLGAKAPTFLGSIVSLVSSNTNFHGVDPNSIMSSAFIAATLDLPINSNLGFAYIVPYENRDGKKAQFQLGYKGFVQLALRTGQYETINATEIYDGELVKHNRLTGEIVIDETKRKSDKIIGYASYFKLLNGFEKTYFMTIDEVTAHGKRYSKSFSNPRAVWQTDFDGMAKKTVLKLLLSKFGILSVEMQKALEVDQAIVKEDSEVEYPDNPQEPIRAEQVEVEAAKIVRPEIKSHKTRVELLGHIKGLPTLLSIQQFKGEHLMDIEALTELEREEVVQAIHTREMELEREKTKTGTMVLYEELKKKVLNSRLKTTLTKYQKEIEENKLLSDSERQELMRLVEAQQASVN